MGSNKDLLWKEKSQQEMKELKPAKEGFENKSSPVAGFFKRILVCFKYFTVARPARRNKHFPFLVVCVTAFPHFLDLYVSDRKELQNNLMKKKN